MKRLILACFIAVIALLAAAYFTRRLFVTETDFTRARVVVPIVDTSDEAADDTENDYKDDYSIESFITLENGETLISAVTLDSDGDGYDDQLNVIKTATSPYLQLVLALYNVNTMRYDRTFTLPTRISQVRSFACTALDVTGNHHSAIVYQGITDNGHAILQIYNGSRSERGTFSLACIGDFEAEGTIFIQQLDRDESYELSRAKGTSFPVWVYTSELRDGSTIQDQVQTMYDWSDAEQMYVQVSQKRIAGSSIAEKELSRIQDGTVDTFARFLDGLWYKTENTAHTIRYVFFDYTNGELIFQSDDSEEVYSWQNSTLRRGGMYFSSVNKSIENLQRRVDISLVSLDEIRIRIQDDVRMLISESTLWDGSYRKLSNVQSAPSPAVAPAVQALVTGASWATGDSTIITFDDISYSVVGNGFSDSGRYMRVVVSGTTLLQFKSDTASPFFAGSYDVSFASEPVAGKAVEDTTTLLLRPVTVSPDGFYHKEVQPVTLRLVQQPQ